MSEELEKLSSRVYSLERTVDSLEKIEEKRGQQFDTLMGSLATLTNEVRHLVNSMEKMEKRVDEMSKDVWNAKLVTNASKWLAGIIASGAILTVIAFLFGGSNG